ncbi:DUF262 domain-containing protein [Streptomyces poonensis]|uniref:GmrSD restriction endonucleases N-terminal domain-containing protein n=1 Tax=Streptomyces poonensis TaxID=68255 RepID=A0A918Q1Q6_9ACTN|nr:DUF262 domain-containing protein [Streptomyces poonensis]GGZ30833.1 hypothetical protein GCM10010365_59170 [Streptomyces poonensis]GLJ88242.1 hypothetical protein GCM10017589_08420 [Streptomyces poonensis]
MSQEDSVGSRRAAREQASLFSRYMDDVEDSGAFRVEVGADGRGTDVELELPDAEAEDAADRITAPYDPSKIEIQTSNPTINLLMSRLSNGMIDLAPDFQRHAGIWSDEEQSRLIESLLLRIPIPSFYAAEMEDSEWAIIDGIQRLTAIARFIAPRALAEVAGIDAGPLRLRGLEYLYKDFEGKGYDDLTGRLQIRLNETQVVVHVIRPGTPEEVKFNIFARINTGGRPLTRQEIRHALIPGPARQLLSSLAESEEFLSATGGSVPPARMADREMVLRALAFRLTPPDSFKSQDFDQFLAHAMRQINRLSDEDRAAHASDVKRAMKVARLVFGENAFRKLYQGQALRYPVNKAIFETIVVNLAKLSDHEHASLVTSRHQVVEGFQALMTNRRFERAVSVSTGDRAKVMTRFAEIRTLFQASAGANT